MSDAENPKSAWRIFQSGQTEKSAESAFLRHESAESFGSFKNLCVGLCVGFAENAFREAVKSYRLKVSKKPAASAFLLVLQAFLFLTSTGFDSRTLLTRKA